jgi:hypothetical protein
MVWTEGDCDSCEGDSSMTSEEAQLYFPPEEEAVVAASFV